MGSAHDTRRRGHRRSGAKRTLRRMCLVQLLDELSARGVGRVVFESRQAQDASDRAVLTGLLSGRPAGLPPPRRLGLLRAEAAHAG
jgi:hypothetical protein